MSKGDPPETSIDADPDVAPLAVADAGVPIAMRILQIVIGLLGLGGAYLHAFPAAVHEEHQNYPVADLVTIAWLGLVVIAFWLPDITEVGFGDVSIKTKHRIRVVSNTYETTVKNLANLVQNWSTSSALYVRVMQSDPEMLLESKAKTYTDYVRDRMGEAYEMLATNKDETVRLALWLFDPVSEEIVFVAGFKMSPTQGSYAPGVGMIGKAFVENRPFNEADVRQVPSYESSREGDDPPYRAVLCEPVRWGNDPIGMITVDRSTIGYFDYFSEQIAKGLAAQCALAVKAYEMSEEADGSDG